MPFYIRKLLIILNDCTTLQVVYVVRDATDTKYKYRVTITVSLEIKILGIILTRIMWFEGWSKGWID